MRSSIVTSIAVFLTHVLGHGSHSDYGKTRSIVSRAFNPADPYANWPSYSQLPLDKKYPTKAAWGVWGSDDVNGALNHITNATILAATKEIKLGRAINLNLELGKFTTPINTNRKPLTHLYQPGDGYADDVVVMNTQVGTQYDGLRHFPYSTNASVDTYQWYNDLIADFEDVIGPAPTTVLGIQQAAQKGIAGRAVLLDWAGYADAHNIKFDAFSDLAITPKQWDAVAAWQGLPANWAKPGDILLTRTGWLRQFNKLNATEMATMPWTGTGNSVGFEAGDASAEWLWNKKLALVGADNPAFESLPFNKKIGGVPRSLHQIFIGGECFLHFLLRSPRMMLTEYCLGWGQSIVEFLDLEVLAETLHSLGRSTFFLTIQNLNVVSGIASPPNALAIL
jgi:hypothetical protein